MLLKQLNYDKKIIIIKFCFIYRLTVPDLKPNIGLFWYFFTEMFEHFRLLFVCAFQINALALYVVPLTLRFHKEPVLLATVLIALSTIFRSYPCIGDVGFYLALFPLWKHLFLCEFYVIIFNEMIIFFHLYNFFIKIKTKI